MKIVFTPDWFLAPDVLIAIFSFVTLLFFFFFSVKSYKISRKRRSLFLGLGFLLVAIAELSIILTKFVLYYDFPVVQQVGQVIVTSQVVRTVDIFYHIGFFFHKFLTLLGFYIIYKLPKLRKPSTDFLITVYLLLVVSVLSQFFYYFFHLTALLFLVLIIKNYSDLYKKGRLVNTKILLSAFVLLAISQMIFILSKLNVLYAIAQSIQLVSYVILLVLILKIQKNGKEKKQNRDNLRYA